MAQCSPIWDPWKRNHSGGLAGLKYSKEREKKMMFTFSESRSRDRSPEDAVGEGGEATG